MKNILVIVDVQNDFVDGALGSEEARNCIPGICKKIEEFSDGLVIATQDTHNDNYLETKEGKALPVKHCVKFSGGWGVNSEVVSTIVAKQASDSSVSFETIEKPTFGSTELLDVVADYVGNEEFDITFVGFCTDICVISNALMVKARFYEQANVQVDASCCAGVTPARHEAALEVMRSCQIVVR